MSIETLEQLQQLVRDGFTDWRSLGEVYAKYHNGLVLFNYTPAAQHEGRWNWFERVSRGLILDATTGEIVARPFDKFFNWGERELMTDAALVNVTEKMDGSLGIAYWHLGDVHVATRGSFDSEQAQWATEWLRIHILDKPDFHTIDVLYGTMLFEIIYPENRVVVDYGDRAELVLLAIRDRQTGDYADWEMVQRVSEKYDLGRPFCWLKPELDYILEWLKTLDANKEGFVGVFADGQRFKFKGEAYKELHRLVCGLSFRRTLEAVANGTVDQVRAAIPDEFLGQFNEWVEEIEHKVWDVTNSVSTLFEMAPIESRKDFALWVKKSAPNLAPYMFAKFDGRDYSSLIYKREFAA